MIKPALGKEEFERLGRPKLKLFLSVDIVGSTQFKQRKSQEDTPTWVEFFTSFYSTFPDMLAQALNGFDPSLRRPGLWKALGDELIFTVELKKRSHAAVYVRALSKALRSTANNWHTDHDKLALHLKGAAWLVGFPVANLEIPLNRAVDGESSSSQEVSDGMDYLGPLVDIGFRLKEHSSSRKLVLSADLAYMMIESDMVASMSIRFDDEIVLKGVLGGKPYPLIWLDNDGEPASEHITKSANLNRLKDKLKNPEAPSGTKLSPYLKAWLESVEGCPLIPFIREDPNPMFSAPADYNDRLEKAQTSLRKVFYSENPKEEEESGAAMIPEAFKILANMTSSENPSKSRAPSRPAKKKIKRHSAKRK